MGVTKAVQQEIVEGEQQQILETETLFTRASQQGHTNWYEGTIKNGYNFGFNRNDVGENKSHPSALPAEILWKLTKETSRGEIINIIDSSEISDKLKSTLKNTFENAEDSDFDLWINGIDKRIKANDNWGRAAVTLLKDAEKSKDAKSYLTDFGKEMANFKNALDKSSSETINISELIAVLDNSKFLYNYLLNLHHQWRVDKFFDNTDQVPDININYPDIVSIGDVMDRLLKTNDVTDLLERMDGTLRDKISNLREKRHNDSQIESAYTFALMYKLLEIAIYQNDVESIENLKWEIGADANPAVLDIVTEYLGIDIIENEENN